MFFSYNKLAEAWTAAFPIRNGRLGAMVFGGVERERIQLNEETLWEGRVTRFSQNKFRKCAKISEIIEITENIELKESENGKLKRWNSRSWVGRWRTY